MIRWLGILALVAGCGGEPEDTSAPGDWSEAERAQLARLRLPDTWPGDPTNPRAGDEAMRTLGAILFFDAALSSNKQVSCGTCHKPERHFADGLPIAEGVGTGPRHTPTIVGSQQGPWYFWDGRADSLWSQALGPMEHPQEMRGDRVSIARYTVENHSSWYERAFGEAPDLSDRSRFPERARPHATGELAPLSRSWEAMSEADRVLVDGVFANVGKALAAYELTLMPLEAPFDRYVDAVLAGDATGAGELTDEQVLGLDLFLNQGSCVLCHNGPLLSDRAFHNNGVPESGTGYDPGRRRGAPLVLGNPFNCKGVHSEMAVCDELDYLDPSFDDFQAAFKTPTLRYVDQTAPYFHNGSHATLEDVVDFYDRLPGKPVVGHRELTLRPLGFNKTQQDAIVAFLSSLTGEPVQP